MSVRFAKPSDIWLNSGFGLNKLRIWGISLNFRMLLLHRGRRRRDLGQNAVKTMEKGLPFSQMALGEAGQEIKQERITVPVQWRSPGSAGMRLCRSRGVWHAVSPGSF